MEESIVTDDFAEKLQQKILRDIRKLYPAKIVQHWQHPRNWGILNKASGYAKITGPCGDTMELSIEVKHGVITRCTFDTDGCGTSIACGSIITEMASGMTITAARNIDQQALLTYCGGLPDQDKHCALLAVNTLHKAIDDHNTTHP
jgi:nitrogen fixation NifU-like protein